MNSFKTIDTYYIRSSRTLETILVSDNEVDKTFYVYNYGCISYRVFNCIFSLINFFQDKKESDYHFNNENELDIFFANLDLKACK